MLQKSVHFIQACILMLFMVACAKGPAITTVEPGTSGNPAEGGLVISDTNAFVDAYGTYRVVGMLVNTSNTILTSINLTIEIRDAAGNSLLNDTGTSAQSKIFQPMLFTLGPGEGSPFEYSYDTSGGMPASYIVTVTGEQPGSATRADLTAENVQLVDNGSGWYYLTGELVNKGTQWAHANNLAGGVLDSSNKILSADWSTIFVSELAPAGDPTGADRTPFIINFPNPGLSVTPPWSLYWDADVSDSAGKYPMSVTITNEYIDQYGGHHVIGWVQNQSDQALNSFVVAGLYNQEGNVLDASFSPLPSAVMANGSMPFSVSTFANVDSNPEQAAQVRTYTAQIDPWNTTPPMDNYIDLVSTRETVERDGATWILDGTVTNNSGKELNRITVIASILDAQNNLVAMEYTTIFPSGTVIAKGESNSYSVPIFLDPTMDSSEYTTSITAVGEIGQ
jgi:hypothetical protein